MRSQKSHPTPKLGSDTRRANELLIEVFLKKDQTRAFVPLWGTLHIITPLKIIGDQPPVKVIIEFNEM